MFIEVRKLLRGYEQQRRCTSGWTVDRRCPVTSRYITPLMVVQGAQRTTYTPRRRFSVTADILSYRRCHRQYGLQAVHGYEPSRTSQVFFGTVIHQVLDRAHAHYHGLIDPGTRNTLPTSEDIERFYRDVAQSLRTRGIRGATARVEERALNIIQCFNEQEGPDLYPRVVDSEHRMQADEETYVLHGTADLLVAPNDTNRGPETLEIWDYKGTRRPASKNRGLQDYLFQMRVYADLYRRRHGVYPARAQLYFLNELYERIDDGQSFADARAAALLTVPIIPDEVEEALSAFRQSVADIEVCRVDDRWEAPVVGEGPGLETCSICDHRWNCPTVRGDRRLNDALPLRYP